MRIDRWWGIVPVMALFVISDLTWQLSVGCWAITVAWVLFGAPLWCGVATNHGEPCRNNAFGVMRACKSVNKHNSDKFRQMMQPASWTQLPVDALQHPTLCATLLIGLAGCIGLALQMTPIL